MVVTMVVNLEYNELPLVLNGNNLYYWNKLNPSKRKEICDSMTIIFSREYEHAPDLTELNILFKFILKGMFLKQ